MLYNSLQFLVFFIIVTIWYFNLPPKYRWALLLIASCFFYMAFVPEYILILGFTIVIDYIAGIYLEKFEGKKKKVFLIISLIANVGILAVFKYYNFINFNFSQILSFIDKGTPFPYLEMLLPIGLSFHTFQAMSYTIEVYRGNQKAEKHFGIYALYVMFYPQLVAGPIERPQNVLPQFHQSYSFDLSRFKSGLSQMGWGFIKKVVIADRLAMMVDYVYGDIAHQNGLTILVATIFYSFQIYCDFSGYSDIGIGAARIMGFDLMKNFDSPYLSTSIGEFWRRWHISLSTWFRDYLYIPLGGNRVAVWRAVGNLMIVFLVSGLWHGASWTFVIWGGLHGIFLSIEYLYKRNSIKREEPVGLFVRILKMAFTFLLVTFAWIFFRANDLSSAFQIIRKIANTRISDTLSVRLNYAEVIFSLILVGLLLWVEHKKVRIQSSNNFTFVLWMLLATAVCYFFGVFGNKQFIYFQF